MQDPLHVSPSKVVTLLNTTPTTCHDFHLLCRQGQRIYVQIGQALWVSITSCAAVIAILKTESKSINNILILGVLIWLIGFTLEVIADLQKSKFKKKQNTNKTFISTGLWSKSRHPNYFGEITLWVGIYIISFSSFSDIEFITVISPIFVYILLTRMSGINMLEKIADERYGRFGAFGKVRAAPRAFDGLRAWMQNARRRR